MVKGLTNVGAGFRAPNIADLGTLGDRPGNRFNIPNANLNAENATHGDLGVRHRSERWQFEVVVFALRYSDRIVSVSTGDVTPGGRDIVQSINAATSTIRGLEAGMSVKLSDRLSARAVLNYARGEQRVDGVTEPADRVSPLNGHIVMRYDAGERWQFESWLRARRIARIGSVLAMLATYASTRMALRAGRASVRVPPGPVIPAGKSHWVLII